MIRHLETFEEIQECVDLYISRYNSAFPASREKCIASFLRSLNSGSVCLVSEVDGEIVAWIVASNFESELNNLRIMKVLFMGVSLSGSAAAAAIVELHNAIADIARRRHFDMVLTSCSHRDPNMKFSKILEAAGWVRESYLVMKSLKEAC